MSSNRLIYDTCAYSKKIDESVGPLAYVLNPMKYENCNKCRHELGLVGGPAVSHIQGNLVDLENDLRGATRDNSLCPSKKYAPNQPITVSGRNCNKPRNVETDLLHLPPCQMIRYKPTPLPQPPKLENCPSPNLPNPNVCGQQCY
tara:strand:- start:29 stop:463 length:435 start_codon:yes stop_codon:yes gene_type:complete